MRFASPLARPSRCIRRCKSKESRLRSSLRGATHASCKQRCASTETSARASRNCSLAWVIDRYLSKITISYTRVIRRILCLSRRCANSKLICWRTWAIRKIISRKDKKMGRERSSFVLWPTTALQIRYLKHNWSRKNFSHNLLSLCILPIGSIS